MERRLTELLVAQMAMPERPIVARKVKGFAQLTAGQKERPPTVLLVRKARHLLQVVRVGRSQPVRKLVFRKDLLVDQPRLLAQMVKLCLALMLVQKLASVPAHSRSLA